MHDGPRLKYLEGNLFQCHFIHHKSHTDLGLNPGLHDERPLTNHLSHGMADIPDYSPISSAFKCHLLRRLLSRLLDVFLDATFDVIIQPS
jgi:hypothetical protein